MGDTGGNRVELDLQVMMDTGSGWAALPGARDQQYAARNNNQDQGSVQVNGYLVDVPAGATIKLQARRIGAAVIVQYARISCKLHTSGAPPIGPPPL